MKKRSVFTLFLSTIVFSFVIAQQVPKREMRGAWIATFANIDWPNRSHPPALQRATFISILDHHKATGMNTLFVQIRSQCDAMYPSAIEPWSADLTGTQGKAPTETNFAGETVIWDPLKFMINECHKRGIEFHAWINPYRAVSNSNNLPGFAENHVAKQHPEWLLTQGTLRVLDPGLPAVRNHITSVIVDIVTRYDLDGIHFDDYFYPPAAPAGVTPYNDDATYNADPRGFTDRGDWRRDNVNILIRSLNDTLNSIKPWVKFGISPTGIYRNSTNPDIGSATSGLQHYVTLYADSRKWLQEGWVDYIAPQVYWYIGQPGANYAVLIPWWNNQANNGRHIYIGMAGYKVNDPVQGAHWANPSQIPNQVRMNRDPLYGNIYGQAIYNTSSLRSSTKLGFRDSLRLRFYHKPALQPTMPWRDNIQPEAPTNLIAVKYGSDSIVLSWTKPSENLNEFDKVKQFVIYRSENAAIDLTNANNIVEITPTTVDTYVDRNLPKDTTYYYMVTSLDRFHNESSPSNTTDYVAPTIACVSNQIVSVETACSAVLPDYRSMATVSDDVSLPHAISIVQTPEPGMAVHVNDEFTVTLTATDESGKSSSCTFSVSMKDTTSPVIFDSPADIVAQTGLDNTLCSQTVTWNEPTATDNCDGGISYFSRSHEPGSVFPVGSTTVNYIFKDAAGNESSVSFTVTIEDNTKPVVTTRNISRPLSNGTLTISAEDVDDGSWDNCGADSISVWPNTFDCTTIGDNIVTLTVIDNHGNEQSATAVVTVVGVIPQVDIQVSRTDDTYTGLPANTVALGYGAQSLTLEATNTTSSSGTNYQWNPAVSLSSTTTAITEFSPVAAGDYTFTAQATNEFGCVTSAFVDLQVIDVRCGNKNNKVEVCLNAYQLCVPAVSVKSLLDIGGTLGSCDSNFTITEANDLKENKNFISASPNPFINETTIQFALTKDETKVVLELYDVYGYKIKRVYEGSVTAGELYSFNINGQQITGSVFIARLITTDKVYNFKLMKE